MQPYLASFKALADSTRLRLLGVLQAGAFNVNELVGILAMGQSRVSRHLKILLDAELVEARREGVWVYYRLSDRWSGGSANLRYLRVLARELRAQLNGEQQAIDECLQKRRKTSHNFFERVAPRWNEHRDQVQGAPEYIEDLASRVDAAATVVDLGTGTGLLLPRLSVCAQSVIGIDSSSEMLQEARRHVASSTLDNVELRLGELEHLPISDSGADAMVANMVLHHVAHPPQALREVHRGLCPGGRFLLADFAPHEEEVYRDKLGDLWLGFERRDLERWLNETGFKIEEFSEYPDNGERPTVVLVSARAEETTHESDHRN